MARHDFCYKLWMIVSLTCCACLTDIINVTQNINIGVTFDCENLAKNKTCFEEFRNGIHCNTSGLNKTVPFNVHIISLPPQGSPNRTIMYLNDAAQYEHITLFIAYGTQVMINLHYIISHLTSTPLIGYATDKEDPSLQAELPLYTSLQPSRALMATALIHLLEKSDWFYACLLVENSYADDSFTTMFRQSSSQPHWHVHYFDSFLPSDTTDRIRSKLLKVHEKQCRAFIMHSSIELTKGILNIANSEGFVEKGSVWFATDLAYTMSQYDLKQYPVGLITLQLSEPTQPEITAKAIGLHARSILNTMFLNTPLDFPLHDGNSSEETVSSHYSATLDRYIKNKTETLYIQPDPKDESLTNQVSVKFMNLIGVSKFRKKWKTIGNYQGGKIKTSTILWPGDTISGPIGIGQRTLRVITKESPPFVVVHDAYNESCARSLPCLYMDSISERQQIDLAFDIFAKHVEGNYSLKCCQGFSIKMLQSLADDLNFKIELFLTDAVMNINDRNDSYNLNILLKSLHYGYAHMAIAPLSITRKRSAIIDFTHPYFYSGFSLLVSEQKRKTPIYAFMEPFDGWVWISIVVSATVVAVVLAIFEWRSPFGLNPWGRKRKTNYTLGSGLNMVYAILFGHTVKTKSPKAWPSKWLQNFWAGASIFIYSSYTANLAAFLAGKNSGVTVSGVYDTRLLEQGQKVGMIRGSAVEEYIRQVNEPLYDRAIHYPTNMHIETAIRKLTNGDLDAYLDDTPILSYARETLDVKCVLRLVNNGFGEDSYGIGLPKGSWLKDSLDRKIIEYHESGYIDELKDRYFRYSHCKRHINEELQGEAEPMVFNQHAGLYVLLIVGIFMCVALMLLEHATFKWLVPYWRHKPKESFWKSMSMMFWSQRLHRIITSEELVSPHHSAREMIEVVKNRDFTKLFQKSVRKQEKLVRNRKNLFNVVEQIQWKQFKEELLSKQSSSVDDTIKGSVDGQQKRLYSTNSSDQRSIDSDNLSISVAKPRRHITFEDEEHDSVYQNRTRKERNDQAGNGTHGRHRWHIDTLLARSLDSLLLKSIEQSNIFGSSDNLEDNSNYYPQDNIEEYANITENHNDDLILDSSNGPLCKKDNFQEEVVSVVVNEPVKSDKLYNKSEPIQRRFSSVDISGVSIAKKLQREDNTKDNSDYKLLANGMVVRSVPNKKALCYTGSDYRLDRRRCQQKQHPKLIDIRDSSIDEQNTYMSKEHLCNSKANTEDGYSMTVPHQNETKEDDSKLVTPFSCDNKVKTDAQKFTKDELYMMWKVSERELKKQLACVLDENKALRQQIDHMSESKS